MDYKDMINYFCNEFNVRPTQIATSIQGTSALKGIDYKNAQYFPEEISLDEHIEKCNGKIPIKMYNMVVVDDKDKKTVTTYSHKAILNGSERTMITTASNINSRDSKYKKDEYKYTEKGIEHMINGFDNQYFLEQLEERNR